MDESIDYIDKLIKRKKNSYVVTPNVDHIVKLENDSEFLEVYNNADLVLTDGMPLVWISKFLKTPIKEKVSGSDLFPKVCKLADEKGYSIFLLGAAEGIAIKAAENLKNKYKNLNIVGTFSPSYGFEKSKSEIEEIIKKVNEAKPDILAVGLGAPKQEKFIYKYKNKLNVPISLAIGASIDFEAGNIERAPKWMQKSGLEWFYRFLKEPKRMFKRYFIDDLKIIKVLIKYRGVK
jgi:glycosyltransferase, WecB/TagA/CpsF family